MSASPAPLLAVENLEAGYGPINVLHRVSLTVHAGEIVTIIGANGAREVHHAQHHLRCREGARPVRLPSMAAASPVYQRTTLCGSVWRSRRKAAKSSRA